MVSVSGIRTETLAQAQAFTERLAARDVPVSLLVSPRLKGGYRLADDAATCLWLRERRAGSDAIVLHGYDQAPVRRRRAEFAVLGAHEADLRLLAADRVLERMGLRTRIFAAPRWNSSPGARQVLPGRGFRINLGPASIDDLVTGARVRARVLGVGDGFAADPWWCRLLIANTARVARRGGIVRLSVAAKQLDNPMAAKALINCVDLALLQGAWPTTYRALEPPAVRNAA
jgi:predicted deacetylase